MTSARRAALVNNHIDVRRGKFPASFYVSEGMFNESLDDYSPPAQVITYANFLATVTNSVSQELYSTIILTSGAMLRLLQEPGSIPRCRHGRWGPFSSVRFPKNNLHQVLLCFSFHFAALPSTFSSWNSVKIRVSASDAPQHR